VVTSLLQCKLVIKTRFVSGYLIGWQWLCIIPKGILWFACQW